MTSVNLCWSLLNFDLHKTVHLLYIILAIYNTCVNFDPDKILDMELLKISCFLPSVDLKWHLNSTKDCRLVACNKVNIRCTHIGAPRYNSKQITIFTFWLHVDFCSGHKINIWYICNHYPVSNFSDTHQLVCVQCIQRLTSIDLRPPQKQ